jgi:hypothetical protein
MKAAMMSTDTEDLQALEQLTTSELSARYLQLFGQPVRTRHMNIPAKIASDLGSQLVLEGNFSMSRSCPQ